LIAFDNNFNYYSLPQAEGGPSMMCVARRVPSENAADFAAQFTTKLDTNGLILSLDTSGITYNACPGLGRVNYPFNFYFAA
jgi:hypothetical protein